MNTVLLPMLFIMHLFIPCRTIKRFQRAFCESVNTPKVLITDNGNQFKSDIFKQFCKDYTIEHRKGARYVTIVSSCKYVL